MRDAKRDVIQFLPAVALLDHRREQSQFAELEHERARQVLILVAAGVGWRKLARGEIRERAAKHLLIRIEGKLHRGSVSSMRAMRCGLRRV